MPLELPTRYITLLAIGALTLSGCGGPEPPPLPKPERPAVAPTDAAPAGKPPKPKAKEETKRGPKPTAYRPPFPRRTSLFEPIRKAPKVARNDSNSGESVVLMGFASVGEPKVVLSIDGVMTPLSAGAERDGVRVISINQPEVVLQRGRSRWTATLQ